MQLPNDLLHEAQDGKIRHDIDDSSRRVQGLLVKTLLVLDCNVPDSLERYTGKVDGNQVRDIVSCVEDDNDPATPEEPVPGTAGNEDVQPFHNDGDLDEHDV